MCFWLCMCSTDVWNGKGSEFLCSMIVLAWNCSSLPLWWSSGPFLTRQFWDLYLLGTLCNPTPSRMSFFPGSYARGFHNFCHLHLAELINTRLLLANKLTTVFWDFLCIHVFVLLVTLRILIAVVFPGHRFHIILQLFQLKFELNSRGLWIKFCLLFVFSQGYYLFQLN